MAGQTLQHTGAAIVEEYYPHYATSGTTTTPLYSDEVYIGSVIILLSMSMLGLPITAFGYHFASSVSGINLSLGIIATVANLVVFLVGLAVCMRGFKKHKRADAHH